MLTLGHEHTISTTSRPATDTHVWGKIGPVNYESISSIITDASATAGAKAYHRWRPSAVVVGGATAHPSDLVQSAAMAATTHPRPTIQPRLPVSLVRDGVLSDAQIESVVLVADAHDKHLPARLQVSTDLEFIRRVDGPRVLVPESGPHLSAPHVRGVDEIRFGSTVAFRQGYMLADGTGCGKGRQVAAILLDQWLRGRRRAIWISASDSLIRDARRDWQAVGGHPKDVIPLKRTRAQERIPNACGILFCTYATLRSSSRQGNRSRLEQIIAWLAGAIDEAARHVFDGCIVFDECHSLANAAGGKGSRGAITPSQQGRAGLRLQNALPDARVLYVSATGASTIDGLAYTQRLGLWGTDRTPFETRQRFVEAIEAGGVAALEVVARDLKSLGVYQARALSYDGVEVDILVHAVTEAQREVYDSYAYAFKILNAMLTAALEVTAAAKSTARATFRGMEQRFFGALITSLKCPTLIRAIEANLEANRTAVVQLVSTGEALAERRLDEIPSAAQNDLRLEITLKDHILDYLRNTFPVTLHEEFTDAAGKLRSRPVYDGTGNPVLAPAAVAMRDALIERFAGLPPVRAALDEILFHFGHEQVAEITGRSRRVLRTEGGHYVVRSRSTSANIHETDAFMTGKKPIMVFSMAGNTGRSYHADLTCRNTQRRVHYLLETGWRADQAIQGLGRTHRTHQRSAPIVRPVTTDIKGERRFTSAIALKLDQLGAITRGQRGSQTAMGDNTALFGASDNLETPYARGALREFYEALRLGHVKDWTIDEFTDSTGLHLDREEELPPMSTFLNRLLALPIGSQNELFSDLETRIDANIQHAIDAGTFDQGVEWIHADSLKITNRETVCTYEDTDTSIVEIIRHDRVRPLQASDALRIRGNEQAKGHPARLMVNLQSKRAALVVMQPGRLLEDGTFERRVRMIRPLTHSTTSEPELLKSTWQETDAHAWRVTWNQEARGAPPIRESQFWMMTGLLLPVWHRLPRTDVKVYRLATDDGGKHHRPRRQCQPDQRTPRLYRARRSRTHTYAVLGRENDRCYRGRRPDHPAGQHRAGSRRRVGVRRAPDLCGHAGGLRPRGRSTGRVSRLAVPATRPRE